MAETIALTYALYKGTYGLTASVPDGATFEWLDESGRSISTKQTVYADVKNSARTIRLVGKSTSGVSFTEEVYLPQDVPPAPFGSASNSDGTFSMTVRMDGTTAKMVWVSTTNPARGFYVSRDGKDKWGNGAWSTMLKGDAREQWFNNLAPGQKVTFRVTNVDTNVSLEVALDLPGTPDPVTPPPADPGTTQPSADGRLFVSETNWVFRSHSDDKVDANSAEIVGQLKKALVSYGRPVIFLNIKDYSFGQFYAAADGSTPRGTIYITDPWGSSKTKPDKSQGYDMENGRYCMKDVALPNGLDGAPGSDGSFGIHDPSRGEVVEGWQLKRNAAGELECVQAGRQTGVKNWDARWSPGLGVAGSGVSMTQTCLTMADFDRVYAAGDTDAANFGRAIYFAVPPQYVKEAVFRFPATRTDGWKPTYSWLEEGTRFILPRSFDLQGWLNGAGKGATPFQRAMVRTLAAGHPLVIADRCGPTAGTSSLESYSSLVKTQPERFKTYDDVKAGYARLFGSKDEGTQFDGFPWDSLVVIDASVKN